MAMTLSRLNRGRLAAPTVVSAPPPGSSQVSNPAPGVVQEFSQGISDAMQGRLSLVLLNTLVIAAIGFYLWTRRAQGGG